MNASNYLETKILDHILGGPDYTRPATVYFALFTGNPVDDGPGTEVTGGAYARVGMTNNSTNFPAATSPSDVGTKVNGTQISFPDATAPWGTVTHFGIFDAASGGNLLVYGLLTTPRVVVLGDAPKFLENAFMLTAD